MAGLKNFLAYIKGCSMSKKQKLPKYFNIVQNRSHGSKSVVIIIFNNMGRTING